MILSPTSAIGPPGGGRRGGAAQSSGRRDDSSSGVNGRSGGRAGGRGAHPGAEDAGNIPAHMSGESPYDMERYNRDLEETTSMVRRTGLEQRSHGSPNPERQMRRSNQRTPSSEREKAAAAAVAANAAARRQNAESRSRTSKPIRTAANTITSPFLAAASSRNPLRQMQGSDPSQRPPSRRQGSPQDLRRGGSELDKGSRFYITCPSCQRDWTSKVEDVA